MVRIRGSRLFTVVTVAVAVGSACRDATNPRAGADVTPPVGSLIVVTSTTGTALDPDGYTVTVDGRSEEHTSELQSRLHLVCRLLLEKKKQRKRHRPTQTPRSKVA